MSDKSVALRAKSDAANALQVQLPGGFFHSKAPTSLLVAQMVCTIQRFSRLAGAFEWKNGTAHWAVRGR